MVLVKSNENWMGFDTRNVKTRTMKRWIVFWMQAQTTSTTNWHAMFSLYTKLDTGMILLKNKLKSFLRILKPFNFKYKYNGSHDPFKMTVLKHKPNFKFNSGICNLLFTHYSFFCIVWNKKKHRLYYNYTDTYC